jgi:hypothetical protein
VLSELARQALTGGVASAPCGGEAAFYGFRPLPADGRVVSEETVECLRDELGI